VRATGFYATWLPKLVVGEGRKPGAYSQFGDLAAHLRFAERTSRKLARSTFYGIARWQARLEQRQSFLGRIVDIGAELFAIAAAVVYADTVGSERPEARELADLFCRQARRRVDALFGELWSNDDRRAYGVAMDVLDGRHAWIEEGALDPAGDGPLITDERPAPAKAG
jgi:hypothetical protein